MGFIFQPAPAPTVRVPENEVVINSLADFPAPVGGVITLAPYTTYTISKAVDLAGNRLQCAAETTILGRSTGVSILSSTLSAGQALLSSAYSLHLRDLDLRANGTGAKVLNLDATANPGAALDWQFINFTSGEIGTIKNYNNCIFLVLLCAGEGELVFDGTINTVGISDTLFTVTTSGKTALRFAATCNIARRARLDKCSFIATSGTTAIDMPTAATVPAEGLILQNVNFSGAGTYMAGVQSTDNKALVTNSRGVSNSSSVGFATMFANAIPTVVTAISTAVKALGTTNLSIYSQKFDAPVSNRLRHTGALTRTFRVNATVSMRAGNNQKLSLLIAKGTATTPAAVIAESESEVTTSGTGTTQNVTCGCVVLASTGDYFEVWVANQNALLTAIVVENLTLSAEALP